MATSLGTLSVKLKALTGEFVKGMSQATKSLQNVQQETQAISGKAGAVGLGLGILGGISVKMAADFESSITRVGAVSRTLGTRDFGKLQEAALLLGANTEFSAKQAADGMQFMAMAGMDARSIIESMPSVLQLATAGKLELANAADIVTNVMKGMGLETQDLAKANDALVNVMTRTNVNTQQLGEAFKYVGPIAKTAGVGFEEVTSAIGLLGNVGIQGSMAGTTLRMAISKLVNPSEEAKGMLDQLGVSSLTSGGKVNSLAEVIKRLQPIAGDTSAILKIFGVRAGPGMAALLNIGSDALKTLTQNAGTVGTAAAIQSAMLQTFSGKMKILESAIEGVAISFGMLLKDSLKPIVGILIDVVSYVNGLSDGWKEFIVIGVSVAAGLAALLTGLSAIAAIIPALATGFATLGVVTHTALLPVSATIAGIVLGIAGLMVFIGVLKNHWKELTSDTMFSFNTIKMMVADYFPNIYSFILSVHNKFIKTYISSWWDSFKNILSKAKSFIGKLADMLADVAGMNDMKIAFAQLTKKDVGSLASAGGGAGAVIEPPSELWSEIKKGFMTSMDSLKDLLPKSVTKGLDQGMADLLKGMPKQVQSAMNKVQKKFVGGGGKKTPVLSSVKPGMSKEEEGFAKEALIKAKESHDSYWKGVDELANSAASKATYLKNKVVGLAGGVGSAVTNIVDGFKQGGIWGGILAMLSEFLQRSESFQAMLSKAEDQLGQLGDTLEPLFDVIETTVDTLGKSSIFEGLKNFFKGFGDILQPIITVLNTVVGLLLEGISGILSKLGSSLSFIANLLRGVFDMLGPLFDGISAVIDVIVTIVGVFAEMTNSIFSAIQSILKISGVFKILKFVFEVVGAVLKGVALVVLGIMWALGKVWNAILEAIAKVLAFFGADKAAKNVRAKKMDTNAIEDQMNEIISPTAKASSETARPIEDLGDAARDTAAAMNNLPSGFKVAGYRLAALDAIGENISYGASNTTGMGAGASSAGGMFINNVTISEPVVSGSQLLAEMVQEMEWQNFNNTGNPTGQTMGATTGATNTTTTTTSTPSSNNGGRPLNTYAWG